MADYPRGRIALGSGDLFDVTDVSVTHTNNGKIVHTLRQKGAGTSLGVEETTIDYNAAISEDGSERDYFTDVKRGTIRQLRVKVPGETMTVNGIYTTRAFTLPLDTEITLALSFIGKMVD